MSTPFAVSADELRARVRARCRSLSAAEVGVAELFLSDPGLIAASTVTQLKARLGISEASIIRAARHLDFAGYPQLRIAAAQVAGERRHAAQHYAVAGDVTLDDSAEQVIAKLSAVEQQALRETAAELDPDVLTVCAQALADARRIVAFGMGASGLVAQDLAHKLTRAGLICQAPADPEAALTAAALLHSGDVAVLISERGQNRHTLRVRDAARRADGTTVAITGTLGAELAEGSDHVLIAATHGAEFRPAALASRMGQLLVIDCLFVAVIQRTWALSEAALAATRDAVEAPGA